MEVFYSQRFWAQLLPGALAIVIFTVIRFKTSIPRRYWWLCFLLYGAIVVAVSRTLIGEPIHSESTFWWWLQYAIAAVFIDRAKLSQLAGRKTII
jgi:hypothetical protein